MRQKGLFLVCIMFVVSMLVASDPEQKMKLDRQKGDPREVIVKRLGGKVVRECLEKLAQADRMRERKKERREKREPKAINHYDGDDEQ